VNFPGVVFTPRGQSVPPGPMWLSRNAKRAVHAAAGWWWGPCDQAWCSPYYGGSGNIRKKQMTWTTPTLVEICIGLEINGYLPAEF
jgi:coenzyme PQQ precursor peptide PqqA